MGAGMESAVHALALFDLVPATTANYAATMAEVSEKVQAIFQRITGDRAAILRGSRHPAAVNARITAALQCGKLPAGTDEGARLDGIGFHLVDWNAEAAFLVALLLYPEEFTDKEIRDGVEKFLIHAPAHCIEAARLGGCSTENVFLEGGSRECL